MHSRSLAPVVACALAALVGALVAASRLQARAERAVPDAPTTDGAIPGSDGVEALSLAPSPDVPRLDEPPRAEVPSAGTTASEPSASIEATVLWRGEPRRGAAVELVRLAQDDYGFLFGTSPAPTVSRARTDGFGVARFSAEPPGARGLVAHAPDGGEARLVVIVDEDDEPVQRVFPLGAAGLEGRVHDLAGRPVPGARVVARQDAPGTQASWFRARTDSAGAYRLGGLAGGPEHPVSAMVAEPYVGETEPLVVAPDSWRRLDFGSPIGSARWTGVVRVSAGSAVGPGLLFLTEEDQATARRVVFDDDGRFEVTLPAGVWSVRLADPRGLEVGREELAGEVARDVVVPGATLLGRIRYVGSTHPLARGPEREAVLALEREDGRPSGAALLRGDRSYAFVGLAPGRYELVVGPWIPVDAPGGRRPVELAPGEEQVRLDLDLTDP